MKTVDFYCFSGTGNTHLVVDRMMQVLRTHGAAVRIRRIEAADPKGIDPERVLGLAFPVAAQSTYPFVWEWLEGLPKVHHTPVFVVDTLAAYSGGLLGPLGRLLSGKGYRLLGAREIVMPNNFLRTQSDEDQFRREREDGLEKADHYAHDLLAGRARWGRGLPLVERMLYWLSRWSWGWRKMRAWRGPGIDEKTCTRCGLCARLCPVRNIAPPAEGQPPLMGERCVLCMRCFAYCPVGAIRLGGKAYRRYRAVPAGDLLHEDAWAQAGAPEPSDEEDPRG